MYLKLVLVSDEALDRLTMACSMCNGALMRMDGHVLSRALKLEAECQRKQGRQKREATEKEAEEESMKVGLSREDEPC